MLVAAVDLGHGGSGSSEASGLSKEMNLVNTLCVLFFKSSNEECRSAGSRCKKDMLEGYL